MIPMIFIGIILNHLGLLHGLMLFWYIIGFVSEVTVSYVSCSVS